MTKDRIEWNAPTADSPAKPEPATVLPGKVLELDAVDQLLMELIALEETMDKLMGVIDRLDAAKGLARSKADLDAEARRAAQAQRRRNRMH